MSMSSPRDLLQGRQCLEDHKMQGPPQVRQNLDCSGKKWCKYALDIFMRNKAKATHHKVMRLSTQQQSYQVDTLHNPGSAGAGDHIHGVNLL